MTARVARIANGLSHIQLISRSTAVAVFNLFSSPVVSCLLGVGGWRGSIGEFAPGSLAASLGMWGFALGGSDWKPGCSARLVATSQPRPGASSGNWVFPLRPGGGGVDGGRRPQSVMSRLTDCIWVMRALAWELSPSGNMASSSVGVMLRARLRRTEV